MLAALTEFPHAGSRAYLRPTAEACRIIRHNPGQGTVLIMLPNCREASGTRTVPIGDLAGTEADALAKLPRRRGNRR